MMKKKSRRRWMAAAALFTLNYSLFVSPAGAQTAVSDYLPGVTPEGFVYFLPKTAIRVSVLVEKTTYQPGEFSKYAQRNLRLNNVGQEPAESYRVISVKQQPVGVPDSLKAFSVKLNSKTAATNVALSEEGLLLAINADPRPIDQPKPFEPAPKPAVVDGHQFMNEEILSAGSTAKMAELTAREIYDLRENRSLLIKGQADFMPKDGAQMQLMLNQLDMQERALSQLFSGVTICDTTETIITVAPDGPLPKQVLFRLSQKLGMVDADDLSGEPYYICTEDLSAVGPTDEEAKSKRKQPENGLYVNVAGKMRSTIYRGKEKFSTMEFPCAQFGNVELLSGDLFNKRFGTHLWLNPITGTVDRIEAEQPK
ncbi:MAG: DUF4831 family protein [Prevotella sp.]|nr:DUF4831 family protein [Prevotella sp.]